MVHINNTKHITIANMLYLLETAHPCTTKQLTRIYTTAYSTSQTYATPVLIGEVNAYYTLWHSYTDDHRGLIAYVINNLDHITLNTNTSTRVPNTILQQTSSPDINTMSNTLYNRTSWTTQHVLSSAHLPIITTINIQHDYRLHQTTPIPTPTTRKLTRHNSRKTQGPLSPVLPYPPTYTLPT